MNTQLRKIQDRMAGNFIMRLLTCTLLLLGEMQSPSCLPQTRMITENLICNVPTYLGAAWRLVSVSLNILSLN